MALNKIYDTPFERLCLEERPEFSDPESQKLLERIYNRSGYLKIDDAFVKIDIVEGFTKVIYGTVKGINEYHLDHIEYVKDDVYISCYIPEYYDNDWISVDKSVINKARMLGTSVFSQKEFIKADREFLEKIIWKQKGLTYQNGRPVQDERFLRIEHFEDIYCHEWLLKYINKFKYNIRSWTLDENGKKNEDVSITIVDNKDYDNYIRDNDLCEVDDIRTGDVWGWITRDVPNTDFVLVISPVKLN